MKKIPEKTLTDKKIQNWLLYQMMSEWKEIEFFHKKYVKRKKKYKKFKQKSARVVLIALGLAIKLKEIKSEKSPRLMDGLL